MFECRWICMAYLLHIYFNTFYKSQFWSSRLSYRDKRKCHINSRYHYKLKKQNNVLLCKTMLWNLMNYVFEILQNDHYEKTSSMTKTTDVPRTYPCSRDCPCSLQHSLLDRQNMELHICMERDPTSSPWEHNVRNQVTLRSFATILMFLWDNQVLLRVKLLMSSQY